MKQGTLVSKQTHPRPQAIRHGVVQSSTGKHAWVKFHGSLKPTRIALKELKVAA
jgi:hypothetical protein